ncbi:hypothetical protein [Streptomyces sp. ISL-86]|uniref:hypothetical protein n=1 Tax=Streptomyces sp. ISL-86 TaxID=2819187 RepID=UPI002034B449|nr:hypothetical protein [Streptomyces sp. ISL-86]
MPVDGMVLAGNVRRHTAAAVGVVTAALVLCGCGASAARQDAALQAGRTFESALASGDYTAACELLAPQSREQLEEDEKKKCAPALQGQDLPHGGAVRGSDVYGRQARLRLEDDTLFLSQFNGGWKVVAAGCTWQSGKPYSCSVRGE